MSTVSRAGAPNLSVADAGKDCDPGLRRSPGMNHPQKGTRVSHASSSARKPLLRRSGVAGLAHSGAFRGSGAPSLRLLGLALILAAAFFAVVAAPASAKQIHVFKSSFGGGELENPLGVAINEASGDVYVVNQGDASVKVFDSSGTSKAEIDGSTTPATSFENPTWIAIDNNPLSPSAGDVYVADNGHSVIDKFKADGTYLGQITSGEGGNPLGQIYGLATDPEGKVWVFQESGEIDDYTNAEPNVFVTSRPSPRGTSPGLAVDSEDNLYVNTGNERFAKANSAGTELIFAVGSQISSAAAVDPANNDVYVDNLTSVGHFNSAPSCTPATPCEERPRPPAHEPPPGFELERFGSPQLTEGAGLAVNSGSPEKLLYVADKGADEVHVFKQVAIPDVTTAPATEVKSHSALLHGTVTAAGGEATCRFAWGTTEALTEAPVPCPAPVPNGPSAVPVEVVLPGLAPNTTYFFRLEAENANGLNEGEPSQTQHFTTPGPATIEAAFATEVSADSATLGATIAVHGVPTTYRFQYGTTTAYGTTVPVPDGPLGSGTETLEASQRLQGLVPATTYHFRVLTTSEVEPGHFEETPGPDRAFTTQPAPFASRLPDARAWELVSPPDKRGGAAEKLPGAVFQVAASGDAATYLLGSPPESDPAGFSSNRAQALSTRTPSGWRTLDIDPPHETAAGSGTVAGRQYRYFSEDLSRAILQPAGAFEPSLSPQATEQTPFLRTDLLGSDLSDFCTSSCYTPLVTGAPGIANVPPGTEFGEESRCAPGQLVRFERCGPYFEGADPRADHVVFWSVPPLAAGAPAGSINAAGGRRGSLYLWSAGRAPDQQIRLLSVLPDGTPAPVSEEGSSYSPALGSASATANGSQLDKLARNAISSDGDRVVWSAGAGGGGGNHRHLYLRYNATEEQSEVLAARCTELQKACALQLDALQGGSGEGQVLPVFQGASLDGSVVYFTDTQKLLPDSTPSDGADLYRCQIVTDPQGNLACELTDLTAVSSPVGSENTLGLALGSSADGSSAYFVSTQVLAQNTVENAPGLEQAAQPGQPNLYLFREGQTTFIATLDSGVGILGDSGDKSDWSEVLRESTARVSPNGHWLAFMSKRPLTGYDNRDARTGQPDYEVYLYHAPDLGEPSLVCPSCNPTGSRPRGIDYFRQGSLVNLEGLNFTGLVAANIPGWTEIFVAPGSRYQPRYLSDSGRLFFNSADALAPADTNGTLDVYQYEPLVDDPEAPANDTCSATSRQFTPASAGCTTLISAGTSRGESIFLDASESGDDVFFLTSAQLSKRDTDTAVDLYDARVGGGEGETIEPIECAGDACQQPAVPPNDPTPGSLTFSGAGNLTECPKGKVKRSGKCVAAKKSKKHKHHKNSKKRHAKVNHGGAK
jgi:hypothetical protein